MALKALFFEYFIPVGSSWNEGLEEAHSPFPSWIRDILGDKNWYYDAFDAYYQKHNLDDIKMKFSLDSFTLRKEPYLTEAVDFLKNLFSKVCHPYFLLFHFFLLYKDEEFVQRHVLYDDLLKKQREKEKKLELIQASKKHIISCIGIYC